MSKKTSETVTHLNKRWRTPLPVSVGVFINKKNMKNNKNKIIAFMALVIKCHNVNKAAHAAKDENIKKKLFRQKAAILDCLVEKWTENNEVRKKIKCWKDKDPRFSVFHTIVFFEWWWRGKRRQFSFHTSSSFSHLPFMEDRWDGKNKGKCSLRELDA